MENLIDSEDYRGEKKKINFSKRKENFCSSLNEVEKFLCGVNRALNYIEFYKLLKY